jgi:C1A family cysteine protease
MEAAFMAYISDFGKNYSSMYEFNLRFEQFIRNYSHIITHNSEDHQFTLGLNQFSDWTQEEYKSMLTYEPLADSEIVYENTAIDMNAVSNSVNWVTAGAVNPVKNQGGCGSCWTFSTMAIMESTHKIKSGKLLSFSEQQLVDCVTTSHGCSGGNVGGALNYLMTNAAMSEASYPYTAKDGTCKYSSTNNTGVKSTSWTHITARDTNAMKTALAKSPFSIAIEADQRVFQSYKSGIFNATDCGTTLDHATAVVGWGTSNGVEYWLMRNSWGASWGESGYMRIQIVSGDGICGINIRPLYTLTN